MKLLLDTHTLLWFIEGSSRLSACARALIEDEANELFLSVGDDPAFDAYPIKRLW